MTAEHIISKIKNQLPVQIFSSSLALKKITEKYSSEYFSAPTDEINVVEKMKAVKADIGGEGNGVLFFCQLIMEEIPYWNGFNFDLTCRKKFKKLSELKQILPELISLKLNFREV